MSDPENIKNVMISLGIVGAAVGSSLGGSVGLLAGVIGSFVASDFIAEPISGKISRLGKSNHIIEVLNFMDNGRK
jgi:Na+-driven multidrug efflux pump